MTLDANLVPGVTRVNGGIQVGNWVGRPQTFVNVALTGIETSYGNVDSDAEKVMRVLEEYASINMVGTPASGNMKFMVDLTTLGTDAANLKTAMDSATGGTTTVTIVNLSGSTFA